eukprot:scaffold4545_cov103-Alexandrium_tamarense.AAC.20
MLGNSPRQGILDNTNVLSPMGLEAVLSKCQADATDRSFPMHSHNLVLARTYSSCGIKLNFTPIVSARVEEEK